MKKQLRLWTQGPMRRIFPHDPPRRARTQPLEIVAARGETQCLQVGVRVDGFLFNYITAEVTDLAGPGRARIGRRCVDVLYPEYVPVKWQTGLQRPGDVERPAPGFFPDPLMHEWKFVVAGPAAPPTHSIWLRVRVPRDARAGQYRATVMVTVGRRNFKAENQKPRPEDVFTAKIRFRLRVWDFALPERTGLLTTYWFFPEAIAEWYDRPLWSAGFWKLLKRFATDMADHRQNVILTPILGHRNRGTQLVDITRRGRRYSFDFRRFDRWCRIFLKRRFEIIEGQHVASGCVRTPEFCRTRPDGGLCPLAFDNAQDPRYEEFLRQFMRALWEHLGRRGWRKHYVQHISDEPGPAQYKRYRRLAEIVRAAAPGIRLADAVAHAEYADLMDYPVPLENCYDDLLTASGRRREDVWVYYCCGPTGPWPNRFIDYPPIRVRIISWLCFRKGIPAFLHWGYNFWTTSPSVRKTINPWDDPTGHRWPAGDPMAVYPPRDSRMGDEIIGSIRWELTREALQDYEYLRMVQALADKGGRLAGRAEKILRDVFEKIVPDWTTYTRDEKLLERTRRAMGRLLADAAGR